MDFAPIERIRLPATESCESSKSLTPICPDHILGGEVKSYAHQARRRVIRRRLFGDVCTGGHSRCSLPEICPEERADLDRTRRPQSAHCRGQYLVSRRIEERAAREDRVCPSIRASDVRGERTPPETVHRGYGAYRSHRPERHHQFRSDQLL